MTFEHGMLPESITGNTYAEHGLVAPLGLRWGSVGAPVGLQWGTREMVFAEVVSRGGIRAHAVVFPGCDVDSG